MSSDDKKFYELQCDNSPKGYCDTFVDKTGKNERKKKGPRKQI